ncbi:MAG: hypothetical protein VSS75_007600 [Candidatus Parabeggiatoa sp.]|nr:hypothetical protein [Candidatus Parabeggiatoa sp.]
MVFNSWWDIEKQNYNEHQRIEYFRKWPPPPQWLIWMIDVIWDINTMDLDDSDSFDYSPYFKKTEELGFGTQSEFEQDIHNPKWFQ